jgi:N-acetylneuraminic acid mutarotase
MTDRFSGQQRAERAFEEYFAGRAEDPGFAPLDPGALATPARRRGPGWRPVAVAAVVAVAALAVVVAVVRPFGQGTTAPGVVPAVPAETGGPGRWQQIETPPLGQRYGAISLWANGSFYVLGGISHCGLDERGTPLKSGGVVCRASLPSPGESLADGARYDSAAGTWTAIADAPVPIGRGEGVVAGDALYVLVDAGEDDHPPVLRYDLAADSWSTLPQPADPSGKTVLQLLGWGGQLYASTAVIGCIDYDCRSIDRWDDAAGGWRQYLGEVPALRFGEGALTAFDRGFVSVYAAARGEPVRAAAFLDGEWVTLPAPPLADVPRWTGVAGDVLVAVTYDAAYSLDLAGRGAWQRVIEPVGTGGLASDGFFPRFSDGARVVVAGQLYDPATAEWTDVPALPSDPTFGAFAGNGSQVLGCFVGAAGSMNDCYLLELGPSTAGAPPVAVDSWVATATTPLAPRSGAITVWTGEEFLVVGGRLCTEPATECAAGDAAAFRPDTGRWRSIAAPPVALDDTAASVVLQGRLYVLPASGDGFWSYDATDDRWSELDPPENAGEGPPTLVSTGEVLLALAAGTAADEWFDPASRTWRELPVGTYAAGPGRQAAFTGKELLIARPGSDAGTLEFEVFFHTTEGRPPTEASTEPLGPLQGVGAGVRLVVTDQATVVALPSDGGGGGWYRGGGGEEWTRVDPPEPADGPLRDGLVVGSQVALGGQLFNPGTGAWRAVPDLPDGESGAVQVGSGNAVLSCFPVAGETLGRGCYLLLQ